MDLPFLANLSNMDMLIVLGAAVVFLVMAYMIFKQLMKAFVIGLVSAAIPVMLYLLGVDIGLSVQTVIWFGLAGIATYFVYDVINGWMTIIRIITWPIRHAFGRGKPPAGKKASKEAVRPESKAGKPTDSSPKEEDEEENV
jgi:hypothetical protein